SRRSMVSATEWLLATFTTPLSALGSEPIAAAVKRTRLAHGSTRGFAVDRPGELTVASLRPGGGYVTPCSLPCAGDLAIARTVIRVAGETNRAGEDKHPW